MLPEQFDRKREREFVDLYNLPFFWSGAGGHEYVCVDGFQCGAVFQQVFRFIGVVDDQEAILQLSQAVTDGLKSAVQVFVVEVFFHFRRNTQVLPEYGTAQKSVAQGRVTFIGHTIRIVVQRLRRSHGQPGDVAVFIPVQFHVLAGDSGFADAADAVYEHCGAAFEQVAAHLGEFFGTPHDVAFLRFKKIVQAFRDIAERVVVEVGCLHAVCVAQNDAINVRTLVRSHQCEVRSP